MLDCIKRLCGCCHKHEEKAKESPVKTRQYPPITQKVTAVASTHVRGRSVVLRYKE